MASSKNSPGPHDRNPNNPRVTCIKQVTRNGALRRCKRWPHQRSRLCKYHYDEAMGIKSGLADSVSPSGADVARAGLTQQLTSAHKRFQTRTQFVLAEQSKVALRKLGDYGEHFDPKSALLDNVRSAWRQRQIWEAMLAQIPEEDWEHVGKVPIPGVLSSSKGARIETIQKFLSETTKVATRASKLAIDAGIEERLVRLAEEQSALIADTVRAGIIAGIGALAKQGLITPAAEAAALAVAIGQAATHLRELAAGGKDIIEGVAISVERKRPVEVRG